MDDALTSGAPDTLDALYREIAARGDALPKRLRQCADYVTANPDRVAVSTVAELAQAAEVQPSAVMRFCQELGFSGFSQMQRLFREEYSRKWPDYATRLQNLRRTGEDGPAVLLAEFVEAGRTSLENLTSTVDIAMLERAVDLLAASPLIHLVGYRRAFPVASYLAYALEKMGIPCVLHTAVGQLPTRHALRPGDAVLAITFAPYSAETVTFAEAARAGGHEVVALTDSLSSPLQRLGVVPLLVSEVDVGAFRALSATFALALGLVVAVGARREDDAS
ncbi:DNA-binding MurR/RpiR family transcriptional regulator [Amaricoccus macauensis]|uniref:DNA-binding MurR/RpiR family transcriptional regulator n=1 Tax=Amaricoccus macauensis TaxID=57001 RepID=A0A840SMA3_9RHOB|nr:MurR/RpiR family transcriptional regulator [Amaricoccus macauensis]MBB5222114.1 DNA-binding MurR/RpiR family transcriptional regulator [Amaricoccus macauensis]